MPATHGRCAFIGIVSRPDHSWPGGARLAVHLGLNREHFAFGEGLGADLAPGVPQPCVLTYAWRDWGNRVAAWRMPEMPDEKRLPTSMLVKGAMHDDAPSLMAAIRARGDAMPCAVRSRWPTRGDPRAGGRDRRPRPHQQRAAIRAGPAACGIWGGGVRMVLTTI
jgi:hypothetical protein